MYAFTSPARGKSLHILTVGCFICAILLLSVSGIEGVPYPMIYQISAFALCTVGIYLLVRYVLKQYRYEVTASGIEDAAGLPTYDLVITEIVGKKLTVVARIGLRDIESVTVLSRGGRGAEDKAKKVSLCQGNRVFRYENDPFPPASCYITVPTEQSVLVIPPDERMTNILTRSTT